MKNINETFTDNEFNQLKRLKGKEISWREFILATSNVKKDEEIEYQDEDEKENENEEQNETTESEQS